jgi:hypothetical protein
VDGGQEVNSRQRRVGDEYAVSGIHLHTLLPPPDGGRHLQSSPPPRHTLPLPSTCRAHIYTTPTASR